MKSLIQLTAEQIAVSKDIDRSVLPYILNLWQNDIMTYESGGGGVCHPDDCGEVEEYIIEPTDYIERMYVENGVVKEKAFIIIHKKDLETAKKFLPKNIEVEPGTGGFDPNDYNSKCPPFKDLVFIAWKEK